MSFVMHFIKEHTASEFSNAVCREVMYKTVKMGVI